MRARSLVLALLVALGLVALSDFAELACAGEGEPGDCSGPSTDGRADDEDRCDHCLACLVGHGHLSCLAPEPAVPPGGIGSSPGPGDLVSRMDQPRPREFFHPPLSALL
jgi:hypothetical protein